MSQNTLTLRLEHYRRFLETDIISFPPGVTIISGPNGAGKSTLVEAFLYALFGPKYRQGPDIHTDSTDGVVRVECELFIDDQAVSITRIGTTAELRINNVIQVQNTASSGEAVNRHIAALLGGLTRDQFEQTYIALQGDTAGLVTEKNSEKRRNTIENILQLEVLTRAVALQEGRSNQAKSEVNSYGTIVADELSLTGSQRQPLTQFRNARTISSHMQHGRKFIKYIEQTLTEQQKAQKSSEKRIAEVQMQITTLKQLEADHQKEIEQLRRFYWQQDELRKNYTSFGEEIAGKAGEIKQVEQDIQKYQRQIAEAKNYADASARYHHLQTEKQRYEKRLQALPLIEQCYDTFNRAQTDLNNLENQLAPLATIDQELHQAKEQELQAKLQWDQIRNCDPTTADHETWQKSISHLNLEEQHTRDALKQLTNGNENARCPTCDQRFTEHTPERRIQHLTTWLKEALPSQRKQLAHQKRHIDTQKQQWIGQIQQAEELWTQYHQNALLVEKQQHTRNIVKEQWGQAQSHFFKARQAWLDLREDIPDPHKKADLQYDIQGLDLQIDELKEIAELYTQLSSLQKGLTSKEDELARLMLVLQAIQTKQAATGYDADRFQMALEALDKAQERNDKLRDALTTETLALKDAQIAAQTVTERTGKTQTYLDRFRANVQEYYREARLLEYLEDFKKHFFVANTEEVTRRTTQLLLHAVTDQSILGVQFDKDEFQYIDAAHVPRPISRLSGGEKALIGLCLRIALSEQAQAITRTGRVRFLILDEVLSTLDEERCEAVQRIFEDVQQRGIFEHIIMITHLDTVKQSWRANGLTVQKLNGKISNVVSIAPGEFPLDLVEAIEV